MSSQVSSFPVNIEERIVSGSLNGSMLFNFLMGMYTMVYGGTVYLYSSKKTTNKNRRIILSAISLLYLLCFMDFLLQWYLLSSIIVVNGDTRESIFWGTLGYPPWFDVLTDFLFYSSFIFSDGLLIWRCYHLWGQSIRIVLVPSVLLVVELGLSITLTVLDILWGSITNNANAILYDNISSTLNFVSVGTTVATTFLIGYRIHSASQLTASRSKTLFNRIAVMVIESAAAYAILLLLYAIIGVIPSFNYVQSPMWQAEYYIQVMLVVVAGMAPTVLVARIALQDRNNTVAFTTITHISGLQFGSQPAGGNHSGAIGNSTGGIITSVIQTVDARDGMTVMDLKRESARDGVYTENQV